MPKTTDLMAYCFRIEQEILQLKRVGRYQALGKSGMWITRVANWQQRMEKRLRELWAIGLKVSRCPRHGTWKSVKTANKHTKNPGRMFESCIACYKEEQKNTFFKWLE